MFKVGDKIQSTDNMYYGEIVEIRERHLFAKLFYSKDNTLCLERYMASHSNTYWVLASKYPQIKTEFLGGFIL